MDNHSSKQMLEAKFTEIYEQFRSAVYKFCLVRLDGDSDRAEDCMQNTFMVFYNKLSSGEQINNPRAYLYRIADNFIKKSKEQTAKEKHRIVPIEDYTDKAVDEQHTIDKNLDYKLLNDKLEKLLTPDEQQLLRLKYICDMPIEEIARELAITKQATAKRLQRLRDKIKHSIGDIG